MGKQKLKQKRNPAEVRRGTSKGAGFSLAQSLFDPPPRQPKDFLSTAFFKWIFNYLRVIFTPRRPLPKYPQPYTNQTGIFPLDAVTRVSLISDWGSGTESAYKVMQHVREVQKPAVTIHLGDIYYTGTAEEVQKYFLGIDDWYRGTQRSFALNANHEMYCGGAGYFDHILPTLDQPATYFCLENEYWRVIGLDSGYWCPVIPLAEQFRSTKLDEENIRWLSEVVFADPNDKRPVILLSHHPWFSAFEHHYARLGEQLSPWLDRIVLWFWGHEHRFCGYGKYGLDGHLPVRGRCIGHGGMPVDLNNAKRKELPLVFVDQRVAGELEGDPIGYCGNALLSFRHNAMTIRYFDENGESMLTERWISKGREGGASGKIKGHARTMNWILHADELVK